MKRIFAFLLVAAGCMTVSAQDFMFEFATSDGVIIPDGSVVTITEAEEADDGSGDIIMNSGIYAKNVDADADQLVRIAYDVQTIDNGMMTICFPSACASINRVVSGSTNPGKLNGALHSISTEWFPLDYGTCAVKVRLEAVVKAIGDSYATIDEGPTITLRFIYKDPTKVAQTGIAVAKPVAYYSLNGQPLSANAHGVVLVRMSDGRVLKQVRR